MSTKYGLGSMSSALDESGSVMQLLEALASTVEISLWHCLHDGDVLAIASDLHTQAVTLTVHVPHIGRSHGIPEDVHFLIAIRDVRVALAGGHYKPFEFQETLGATREERSQSIDDFFKKWRCESMAWSEFENALPDNPMEISNAALFTKDGVVILTAVGNLYGEQYDDVCCEFFIVGSSIEAARSDGQPFSRTFRPAPNPQPCITSCWSRGSPARSAASV